MPHVRKFDHEEAVRLYATGEFTQTQLAERYGVTSQAICQAFARRDPKRRERMIRYSREWQREHNRAPCKGGCGALVWTIGDRSGLCQLCMAATRARGVREAELLCHRCEEWKPDSAFPHRHSSKARRSRHTLCRACQTIARQDYRERHKVPCKSCGQPCLPLGEKGVRQKDTGLCHRCYLASSVHSETLRKATRVSALRRRKVAA